MKSNYLHLRFLSTSVRVLDAGEPASCPAVTDFVCHSGDCIESHLVCDNKADCVDKSDEIDCGE